MAAREHQEPLLVARWLEESLGGALGPRGGLALVQAADGSTRVVKGVAALAEAAPNHPGIRPYLRLAETVLQQAGDHATTAVLLAARLVRTAIEAEEDGLPIAVALDGQRLAARQALAALRALWQADEGACIRQAGGPGTEAWADLILDGVRRLPRHGVLDLESFDVRAEPGEQAEWLDGLVAMPRHPAGAGPLRGAGVLLLAEGWRPRAQADIALRVRSPGALQAMQAWEEDARRAATQQVAALGIGLIACARGIDADVADRLGSLGILVWTDAPRAALRRLATATGARLVPGLEHAEPSDLGRATFRRRPARRGGWLVQGAGPSATLLLPASGRSTQASSREAGERLLRAAGLWLSAPGALPGGGRWQRGVATSLRAAADVAPGKAPVAVRRVAACFDALADDLLRNAGLDVLAGGAAPDATGVWDAAEGMRLAVSAAFETARQVLRVDAVHAKRASSTAGLRGGAGSRVGSPKGLPGDIPPLM